MLHHPENFFYTTTFEKNLSWVRKVKNYRTTKKKGLCDFSEILLGYIKTKIIARLKKKGFPSFHTTKKFFLHQS